MEEKVEVPRASVSMRHESCFVVRKVKTEAGRTIGFVRYGGENVRSGSMQINTVWGEQGRVGLLQS